MGMNGKGDLILCRPLFRSGSNRAQYCSPHVASQGCSQAQGRRNGRHSPNVHPNFVQPQCWARSGPTRHDDQTRWRMAKVDIQVSLDTVVSGRLFSYDYFMIIWLLFCREYLRDVRTAAKGFIALGLKPHHTVCILGFNSPEWLISNFGAIFAG